MYQKLVFNAETNTSEYVNYDRACLIFEPTNLCTSIVEIDEGTTYTPPPEYYYIISDEGEIGWTWKGNGWVKPTDVLIDAYLEGTPTTETPSVEDESLRVANTFWVRQKIQQYVNDVLFTNLVLDGGSFADATPSLTFDAGFFDGTGSNLSDNLHATLFDNTGGNITSNVDADTF